MNPEPSTPSAHPLNNLILVAVVANILIGYVPFSRATDASWKANDAVNFAMDVCQRAGVENCNEIHERWLPDDVLAEELYRDTEKQRRCMCVVESCAYCTDDGIDFWNGEELNTYRFVCDE